jgi:hypothetical protein
MKVFWFFFSKKNRLLDRNLNPGRAPDMQPTLGITVIQTEAEQAP